MTKTPSIVPADRIPGPILPDLLRWSCEESAIFTEEGTPFTATFRQGDARLCLVVGPNASGKSLLHRLMQGLLSSHGVEAMSVSIRERTGADEPGGMMRKAFMFGDQTRDSTGNASVRVVRTGFGTLSDRKSPSSLLLDEPEIGLSDGYAGALGELIGRRALDDMPNSCGTLVVTHSRTLVRGLLRGLGAAPTFAALGGAEPDLEAWLSTEETRSVEDLLNLGDMALERMRGISKLLHI